MLKRNLRMTLHDVCLHLIGSIDVHAVFLEYQSLLKNPNFTNDKSYCCVHFIVNFADLLSLQLGFKMFLGFSPVITNWSAASDEFSLILDNNPLAEFAELPEGHEGLLFSNILCGVLRGALEMVKLHFGMFIWQRSKLRPFWSPWRVKKIFGD